MRSRNLIQCSFLGVVAFGWVACTSTPKSDVASNQNSTAVRQPAEAVVTYSGENFADLIEPKMTTLRDRREIYVVPKIHKSQIRTPLTDFTVLGKLMRFAAVGVAVNVRCADFSKFSKNKFGAEHFFKAEVESHRAADSQLANQKGDGDKDASKPSLRTCNVVELTNLDLKEKKGSSQRANFADEPEQVRIFLNQDLGVRGYQLVNTYRANSQIVKNIKTDPNEAGLGGFEFFPADLPPQQASPLNEMVVEDVKDVSAFMADGESLTWRARLDGFYTNKIRQTQRSFRLPRCEGKIFRFKDYYGQKSTVGWCKYSAWPEFIENGRYLAVTSAR